MPQVHWRISELAGRTKWVRPEEMIAPNLAPGEEPYWVGASSLRAMIQQNAFPFAFGLFFASTPWFARPTNVFAVIVFSLVGLVGVCRALTEIVATGRTAYAITDQRILVVRKLYRLRVKSWLPHSINVTEKKVRADGSGSVVFRLEEFNGLDASGIYKIGLYGIPEAEAAYGALMRLTGSNTERP